MGTKTKTQEQTVVIKPPQINSVDLLLEGTAPLVLERFSKKAQLIYEMEQHEKSSKSKEKARPPRDFEKEAEEARYRSPEGWEGINAAAFRAAAISACRLVGFKMTMAKLSLFIHADSFEVHDGTPMVRVYGDSCTFTAPARNANGKFDIRSRPQYREWAVLLRVNFDSEQFTVSDIVNLLNRVGIQVGVGEGRPDSKSSAGCGWGTFRVVPHDEEQRVKTKFGIK